MARCESNTQSRCSTTKLLWESDNSAGKYIPVVGGAGVDRPAVLEGYCKDTSNYFFCRTKTSRDNRQSNITNAYMSTSQNIFKLINDTILH